MEQFNYRQEEEFGVTYNEYGKEYLGNQSSNISGEDQQLISHIKNNESNESNESNEDVKLKRTSTRNSVVPPPEDRRKSYQVRAMFRKTLSYQKRQIGANLCCVAICPTTMIIIAVLLSLLVDNLVSTAGDEKVYEYCTNEFNGTYFLPYVPGDFIKNGTKNVHLAHYTSTGDYCSYWYGTNDHFKSYPYDNILKEDKDRKKNLNHDTLFLPLMDSEGEYGNYEYLLKMLGLDLKEMSEDAVANYINGDYNMTQVMIDGVNEAMQQYTEQMSSQLSGVMNGFGNMANIPSGMPIGIPTGIGGFPTDGMGSIPTGAVTGIGSLPTGLLPTNIPTKIPTKIPTNIPTNIPNDISDLPISKKTNERPTPTSNSKPTSNNEPKNTSIPNRTTKKINPTPSKSDEKDTTEAKPTSSSKLRKRYIEADESKSKFDQAMIYHLTNNMQRPWAFIAVNRNITEQELIGKFEQGGSNMTIIDVRDDEIKLENKSYLNSTEVRYVLNFDELINTKKPQLSFERMPYYEIYEVDNDTHVDSIIFDRMKILNKILTNTTFDDYTAEEKKQINITDFADTDDAIKRSVDYMPYAALYFEKLDEEKLKYDVTISVGEYKRLSNLYQCQFCSVTPYMSFPDSEKRLVYFVSELNNLIARKTSKNTVKITQGYRAFPEVKVVKGFDFDIADVIGTALFPWGISFLIPIFVIGLVKDKEERYLVMMKMNGMKSRTYYISVYITNLILSIISMLCFNVVGYISGLKFFVRTEWTLLLLEFFVWANVQVVLSFLLSFFFKKNGSALVGSFLVVLISIILALSLFSLFADNSFYYYWAPFAFYHILILLNVSALDSEHPAYALKDLVPGDKVYEPTKYLIIDFIILFILVLYIGAVMPQEYGSHQPWHLNIFGRIKRLFNRKNNEFDSLEASATNPFYTDKEAESAKVLEDDDVKAERERILSGHYDRSSPLVIKNLRKEYKPRERGGEPHVAVHSVTFGVEENVVFGLLGPNGAGKTTLIHSLIGVYTPTAGYAKLSGYNIKTDMDQVYKRIGICPQHDILWGELTVEEHLLFYARLKGIPRKQEKDAINESLNNVGLENFRNRLIKGLSGGERRRVSIAIALVGNPRLVFLDEPTTGLDPDVRRLIWSIINDVSQGRTIVITTHSMEEAEVLCHRIGIMSHGTLRCCATPLRLKELYGSGFRLSYSNNPEKYKELKEYIHSILPSKTKAIRDLASNSIYEFIPTQGLISGLFKTIDENKEKYGIIDWGISQSSLEEVFLSIISEDDANAF
ncbi:hypothetical protein H8356DRAFT_1036252 [Neocallimastix lanati (nom. inval.)]|jgi:ABC-type multidrug transport system ATPase subunit|uniref:ABC transporter domain-containing protein n=1 Tax=Neocallimastix californiae TaxID=1754190 RepID=A0A1Y2EXA0_9FUNG|nr:hypothetical protein H8356DRAFT_1036252 [Neocallimastix sp. JGI-2020a]ORY76198.1 hypothetical protein LY90DRAFT_450904 [Neocallimastix californiae]|eukprot:ORY76198.1 hypothetical protein LY90DRAFT_450904 [Neocallimastix californiae]